jgi:putative DNA methylase
MFEAPEPSDLDAIEAAWPRAGDASGDVERASVLPTELYPEASSDPRPRVYGMPRWADMFSARQLLGMGVLVEELRKQRPEIERVEGEERGAAVEHLLAFVV